MKAAGSGDILVYGSAALTHFLMGEGLVDQLDLMVFPIVPERGKWLFADGVALSVAPE